MGRVVVQSHKTAGRGGACVASKSEYPKYFTRLASLTCAAKQRVAALDRITRYLEGFGQDRPMDLVAGGLVYRHAAQHGICQALAFWGQNHHRYR
jgi:hypothetical protein